MDRFHWWWPLSWRENKYRPLDAFFNNRREVKSKHKLGGFGPDGHAKFFGRKYPSADQNDLESGLSGISQQGIRLAIPF